MPTVCRCGEQPETLRRWHRLTHRAPGPADSKPGPRRRYPEGAPRFIDFWSGKTKTIIIKGQVRRIPEGFSEGDYENDAEFREQFQTWVNHLWQVKDQELAKLHQQYTTNNAQS